MVKYITSLGGEYATDSCLRINDKEYLIESNAWKIISALGEDSLNQRILQVVYDNFDEDLNINIEE